MPVHIIENGVIIHDTNRDGYNYVSENPRFDVYCDGTIYDIQFDNQRFRGNRINGALKNQGDEYTFTSRKDSVADGLFAPLGINPTDPQIVTITLRRY